ncbi:hypothetical protein MNBD_UNCLBAC01-1480 [hydrothermal vent metagenome]|uniref:Uncharacterized protein n=1 Tax=hydrothermal vent metagenome TaxID=652676 RepID=A0A3B1DFX6_9ZZZZ
MDDLRRDIEEEKDKKEEGLQNSNKTSSSPATDPTIGGIDVNPDHFDFEIRNVGSGVSFPISTEALQNMNIQGFIPVILDITPAAMPMFLSKLIEPVEVY